MENRNPDRRRRQHPEEFKQAVIASCCAPGASVADIAMAHGVTANQIRRWMRVRGIERPTQEKAAREAMPAFVQLPITPPISTAAAIQIEVSRGNTAIKVEWPLQASGDCAVWLRAWLR